MGCARWRRAASKLGHHQQLRTAPIEEQLRRGEICQVGEGLGVPVLAIIDSGVVGVAKPAAEIFRHALEPIGVEPEQALYVGDTVRYDVRGARAAGLVPGPLRPVSSCAPTRGTTTRTSSALGEVDALLWTARSDRR